MQKVPKQSRYRDASGRFAKRPAPPQRPRYYWAPTGKWYWGDTWKPAPAYRWDKVRRDALGRPLDDSGVRVPASAIAGKPPVKPPKKPKKLPKKPKKAPKKRPKRPKPRPDPELARLRKELEREQAALAKERKEGERELERLRATVARERLALEKDRLLSALDTDREHERLRLEAEAREIAKERELAAKEAEAREYYQIRLPTLHRRYTDTLAPAGTTPSGQLHVSGKGYNPGLRVDDAFREWQLNLLNITPLSSVNDLAYSNFGVLMHFPTLDNAALQDLRALLIDWDIEMSPRHLRFKGMTEIMFEFNPGSAFQDYDTVEQMYAGVIPALIDLMYKNYGSDLEYHLYAYLEDSDYEGAPQGLP